MQPPCEANGECYLDWWEVKPKWAMANIPVGWETAFEVYFNSQHVGIDYAILMADVKNHDELCELLERVVLISATIKRLEAELLEVKRSG